MRTARVILALIAGIAFLLSACDGNTKREWVIYNNSSTEIFISADTNYCTLMEENIPPGQTITILISNQLGGSNDAGSPSDSGNLNWMIYSLTDTLKKDPNKDDNWDIATNRESKTPSSYSHQFTFEFKDEDF